jgi:hypothetical protein
MNGNPSEGPKSAADKVKLQMTQMRDANLKYKHLLKLAKERIQQQEDEAKRLKGNYTFCVIPNEVLIPCEPF